MDSTEKRFRSRWACFVGEPWFDAMADAWLAALDRDDEFLSGSIVEKLFQTAEQRGVTIDAKCWRCGENKPDLRRDTDECSECVAKHVVALKAQADWEEWWRTATPEERETWPTLNVHGILKRDVQ